MAGGWVRAHGGRSSGGRVRALCAVAVLLALMPAGARASTQLASPPAAGTYAGALDVFWKGADGGLWGMYFDGSWHAPSEVPGTAGGLLSKPLAIVYGGDENVFWRGNDSGMWEASWNGSSWSAPAEVPGTAGKLAYGPGGVEWSNDESLFYDGKDGAEWNVWLQGTQWKGPGLVPGTTGKLSGPPSVIVFGNTEDTFWEGPDHGAYQTWWDGSKWNGPSEDANTAGTLDSEPAAVATTYQELYFKGGDGGLWAFAWDGPGISHPGTEAPFEVQATNGTVASAPSPVLYGSGLDVFFEGNDGALWQESWNAGIWSGPAEVIVPPQSPSGPPPPGPPPNGTTTVPAPKPTRGRRVRVRVSIRWTYDGGRTRLVGVSFGRLPRRATVTIACAGRRCPRTATVSGARGLRRLRHRGERHAYRAGDRLLITIAAPGLAPERIRIRIRWGKLPRMSLA